MKKLLIVLLLYFNGFSVFSQSPKEIIKQNTCQGKWIYLNLVKSFDGVIIFYAQPTFYCGVLSNASVALIKPDHGDTVRILTVCDNQPDSHAPPKFKAGDKVIIQTENKSFRVDEIPYDPLSCKIKQTCYGSIKKNNSAQKFVGAQHEILQQLHQLFQ